MQLVEYKKDKYTKYEDFPNLILNNPQIVAVNETLKSLNQEPISISRVTIPEGNILYSIELYVPPVSVKRYNVTTMSIISAEGLYDVFRQSVWDQNMHPIKFVPQSDAIEEVVSNIIRRVQPDELNKYAKEREEIGTIEDYNTLALKFTKIIDDTWDAVVEHCL